MSKGHVQLKSDYFRIEIAYLAMHLGTAQALKSDYFRIEMLVLLWKQRRLLMLKSDYFRIEIPFPDVTL